MLTFCKKVGYLLGRYVLKYIERKYWKRTHLKNSKISSILGNENIKATWQQKATWFFIWQKNNFIKRFLTVKQCNFLLSSPRHKITEHINLIVPVRFKMSAPNSAKRYFPHRSVLGSSQTPPLSIAESEYIKFPENRSHLLQGNNYYNICTIQVTGGIKFNYIYLIHCLFFLILYIHLFIQSVNFY